MNGNAEIADALRDYARAKADVKDCRDRLVRVAVEMAGIPQEDATRLDLVTFLDGYLVGQGMKQSWRDAA